MTTHKLGATACLLCKEPFENLDLNEGAIRSEQTALNTTSSIASPSSINIADRRNWYVKAVNRRAKGGIVFGALMMVFGFSGKSFTKGAVVIGGGKIVTTGFIVLLIALGLVLATRRRTR